MRKWASLAAVAIFAGAVAHLACKRRINGGHDAHSNAAACLRTYWAAQTLYLKTDYDQDGIFEFAFPYTLLNTTVAAGQPIRLIDDSFAYASRDCSPAGRPMARQGLFFVDLVSDTKAGPYDDGNGNYVKGFGLCAYPGKYPDWGRSTYVIDARGQIYAKDTKGEPVTVFPDVEKEGWTTAGG